MDFLTKALKHIALFLVVTVMMIFGLCFFWMLAVLFFRLTGQLHDGVVNYDGMTAPGYPAIAITMLVSAAVIGVCALLRQRIKQRLK